MVMVMVRWVRFKVSVRVKVSVRIDVRAKVMMNFIATIFNREFLQQCCLDKSQKIVVPLNAFLSLLRMRLGVG